jgi:hypothetical protein
VKPTIWLLLYGATVGTLLDGIHTHIGATVYTHPVMWRAAWWVPLLFASAFAIGAVRPLVDRTPVSTGAVIAAQLAFAGAYAISGWPALGRPVRAAILVGIFAATWALCDGKRAGIWIAAAAAVGGPLTEIALIHLGLFRHLQVDFLAIPMWLPCLYLCAGVSLSLAGKRLGAS